MKSSSARIFVKEFMQEIKECRDYNELNSFLKTSALDMKYEKYLKNLRVYLANERQSDLNLEQLNSVTAAGIKLFINKRETNSAPHFPNSRHFSGQSAQNFPAAESCHSQQTRIPVPSEPATPRSAWDNVFGMNNVSKPPEVSSIHPKGKESVQHSHIHANGHGNAPLSSGCRDIYGSDRSGIHVPALLETGSSSEKTVSPFAPVRLERTTKDTYVENIERSLNIPKCILNNLPDLLFHKMSELERKNPSMNTRDNFYTAIDIMGNHEWNKGKFIETSALTDKDVFDSVLCENDKGFVRIKLRESFRESFKGTQKYLLSNYLHLEDCIHIEIGEERAKIVFDENKFTNNLSIVKSALLKFDKEFNMAEHRNLTDHEKQKIKIEYARECSKEGRLVDDVGLFVENHRQNIELKTSSNIHKPKLQPMEQDSLRSMKVFNTSDDSAIQYEIDALRKRLPFIDEINPFSVNDSKITNKVIFNCLCPEKFKDENGKVEIEKFRFAVKVTEYTFTILQKVGFIARVSLNAVNRILETDIVNFPNEKPSKHLIATVTSQDLDKKTKTAIDTFLENTYLRKIEVNKTLIKEDKSLYQRDLISEINTKFKLEKQRRQCENMEKIREKRAIINLFTCITTIILSTLTFFAGLVPIFTAIPAACTFLISIGMSFFKPKQPSWEEVAKSFDIFKNWDQSDGDLNEVINAFMLNYESNMLKYKSGMIKDEPISVNCKNYPYKNIIDFLAK